MIELDEEKVSLVELLWPLELPPGVEGRLNWTTGLTQVDATAEEFTRVIDRLKEHPVERSRETAIGEAISHESVHFMQIITTGYLQRWVLKASALLDEALGPLPLDWDEMKAILLRGSASLSAQQRAELQQLVSELDEPGPDGISTRCILESHAFFVQQRLHWSKVSANSIVELLAAAPALEYRLGYDLCRFYIRGPAAFALFPVLASLSLFCVRPAQAFSQLLEAAAEDKELLEAALHGRPDMLLQRRFPFSRDAWLGDAGSVYHSEDRFVHHHFVYTPAVNQLGRRFKQDSVANLLAFPHLHLREILDLVRMPILLRSDESGFSTWRWALGKDGAFLQSEKTVQALAIKAAYHHRLLEGVARQDPPHSPFHGLRWLTRENDSLIFLTYGNITPEVIDEYVESVRSSIRATEGREVGNLWGRIVFAPDTESSHEDATYIDDLHRTFLSRLISQIPELPGYVLLDGLVNTFQKFFGAVADHTAYKNGELNIYNDSVQTAVMAALVAIQAQGAAADLNPLPQIQHILRPFPEDSRAVRIRFSRQLAGL